MAPARGPGDRGVGDPEGLTRKQRREAARAERKAAEEARAAAETRRKRLIQLGSAVVAVIVIIVVVIAVTSGGKGSKSSIPKTTSQKSGVVKAVEAELNGIPQKGAVLGRESAPVTLEYFGDLECPICKDFTLGALPSIIANDVRTGKLRIEYRSFNTATGGAESRGAEPTKTFEVQQAAALAAGKQNKGWHYLELFYHEQGEEDSGYVNERYLQDIAKQVPGLDLEQWSEDRADKALELKVIEDDRFAIKAGFKGTPAFRIGKTGQTLRPWEPGTFTESAPYEEEVQKLAS